MQNELRQNAHLLQLIYWGTYQIMGILWYYLMTSMKLFVVSAIMLTL